MGPSRHAIAVAALELTGSEHVLEIGCGHGVAVRLVLERLTNGTITALDRSEKMIDHISASIQDPRLVTCTSALEHADFGSKRFDAIFAINLDLELRLHDLWPAKFRSLLQPQGRVVLLLDPPPGTGKGQVFAARSLRRLTEAGFEAAQLPAPGEMAMVGGTLAANGALVPFP